MDAQFSLRNRRWVKNLEIFLIASYNFVCLSSLGFVYRIAGLVFLDTVDHYINFILILIGFFETFSAGWVYGIEKQIKILGNQVVYSYIAVTFGSIILACAVGFGSASIWTGKIRGAQKLTFSSKSFQIPDGSTCFLSVLGFATLVSFYSVGMSVVVSSTLMWKTCEENLCFK